MSIDLDKIKNLEIPDSPGCYFFHNPEGEIIYIGKAANLRSRVSSYWQKSAGHTPAKQGMLKRTDKITWTKTDSEIEALLLEANLIKKHQPYFNVVMRDDKSFIYIKISSEEKYPRIFMTRKLDQAGRYFGPFTSTEAVKETLKIIRKIWPFRTCVHMPNKTCLYYQINKCPGPCEKRISAKEYGKIIKQISLFLEGRRKNVEANLKREISNLKKEVAKLSEEDPRYQENKTKITRLEYQLRNIKNTLEHNRVLTLRDKYANDVLELAKTLGLKSIPQRIEGYDVSSLFGTQAVGSMVVFSEGEPNKKEYRKFKIQTETDKGDVGMLEEMVSRRFKRSKSDNKETWPKPDLIIVDGGRAQLNTTLKVLKRHSLDIPVMAISKGEKLRSARAKDKIFFPEQKEPLSLPLASPALHIIKRVRDEAHRFAINYHRQERRKHFK